MNNLYYDLGPDVVAFSTRRQGGMSQGNYASLNVNPFCGDNSQHVTANRTLLANELGIPPSHIVLPHQAQSEHTVPVRPKEWMQYSPPSLACAWP